MNNAAVVAQDSLTKMKIPYLIVLTLLLNSCVHAQLFKPCDKKATKETRELFNGLQRLQGAGILFGHHDDTGYGVNWKLDPDSSDVKNVVGAYPAIYGWDLAKIEHDSTRDINRIPFSLQRERVEEAYRRGGINTFCWHMDNPANGRTAWDTTQHSIAGIIPGAANHEAYKQYLDKAAAYLNSLKGKDGEHIPILFRPFHEFTGSWFWWGKRENNPEEFKTLWKFTIDYLRDKKKLHNLLIVYSAADFRSEADFMEHYPGDNYVDMMGFDDYCLKDIPGFQKGLDRKLVLLDMIAAKHHKLSCLAETGYQNIPQADWWTKVLLPIISKYKLTYVLTWRNDGFDQFFAPYPGQISADDFEKFYKDNHMIFQDKLTPLSIYGRPLD